MHGMEPHEEINYWRERADRLSAELAACKQDRDEARALKVPATTDEVLRAQMAACVAEAERDQLRAECERMRAVYEAAVAWSSGRSGTAGAIRLLNAISAALKEDQ